MGDELSDETGIERLPRVFSSPLSTTITKLHLGRGRRVLDLSKGAYGQNVGKK